MSQSSLAADSPRSTVLHEFESAWRLVVEGPPRVEDYLARLPETEREAARRALEQIASRFRSQLDSQKSAQQPNQTVDHRPAPAPSMPSAPPVPESEPEREPTANATVDESQGQPIVSGTVDESEGKVIVAGTVDESEGKVLPTPAVKKAARPAVPGYLILGELGRGGMGVVYKAKHLALDRVVALKMILGGAHVDEVQLARFYTEAQAVARLQHPGVVQVFEISEHDGMPFFSLEYVDGGSLARKINRSPQPPQEAAALLEKIACAVQAAHEKNVIHRDLKPANVLMTADGSPKVTDFGLARRLEGDAGQTRSGSILGTPNYMPPEQARGDVEKVGPLADVYSLGAVLYELLTGRPPFQGTTILETLEQVETKEPVPPVQLAPHVPKDLDTICLKCLEKEPGKRYASAGALADDLRRFLEGRPILARPVSRAERLWRLCRRNPVVSSLTALAAVLVLAVMVGAIIFSLTLSAKNGQITSALEEQTKATKAAEEATEKEKEAKNEAVKARQEETVAKGKAIESAEQREKNTEAALIAMRTVVTRFREKMRGQPQVVQLRKELTQGILIDLQKLSADLKNQPIKDRSLAGAHVNMGEIYVELGDYTGSKEHFDAGEEILARMVKENPESAVAKHNLAAVMNYQGTVAMRLGNGEAARERYARALDLRKQRHQMLDDELNKKRTPHPSENRRPALQRDVYEARISVAQAYGLLGLASLMLGDPEAALGYYQQCKQNYDAVPQTHYDKSEPTLRLNYQRERSEVLKQLGESHRRLGQLAPARKYLAQALLERVTRVSTWPKVYGTSVPVNSGVRRDMIYSRWTMGDLELLYEGNPVATLPYYNSATLSAQAVADQEKDNPSCVQDVAYGHYRLGYAYLRLAMLNKGVGAAAYLATSRHHFEEARKKMETIAPIDPADTSVQALLMLCEARCGQRSNAAARIGAMLKQAPNDPRVLFHAACGYALLVPLGDAEQSKQARDEALAALQKAVEKGWKDAESLRIDPDLDPVRGDPRLVRLEQQLTKKK